MNQAEFSGTRADDGALVVKLRGKLDAEGTARIWGPALQATRRAAAPRLVVDAAELEYCDGSGSALIWELAGVQRERGADFELEGMRDDIARLHARFEPLDLEAPDRRSSVGVIEQVGRATATSWRDFIKLVEFVGAATASIFWALRHPRRVRWRETVLIAEQAGTDAVGIVAIVGFLIGLILAFQSAIPMGMFGAEVFVADLVGLSVLRELGPLMTAIVLAGRSSSAFAAEIGTMRVREEVDALSTMGLDPVRFLVTPRLLAAVFVTPILTLVANVLALLGGLIVYLSMGFPLVTYVLQIRTSVDMSDFLSGLSKSFVFGIIVAGIGCLRGLQTGPGANSVGQSTTRAVVSGIVLIVVADGIFSVVYYALGI